jgi:hypothetical protein
MQALPRWRRLAAANARAARGVEACAEAARRSGTRPDSDRVNSHVCAKHAGCTGDAHLSQGAHMFTRALFGSALLISAVGACASDENLATRDKTSALSVTVTLSGTVHTTARSGTAGTQFVVGNESSDTYALWGISGKETGVTTNVPCWVHVKTENVNDINDEVGHDEDKCGSSNPGALLVADFANGDFTGEHAFVSGAQVCLNSDNTRVKGWILYGRRINDDGSLTDLTTDALAGPRPNCTTWKQRVDCPAGEIATAAVLEFESGSTPRAWQGLSLKCRAVTVQ